MNNRTKKIFNLFLVLLLFLSILNSVVFSEASRVPDEVLSFLKSVVKLNLSEYNSTIYTPSVTNDEKLGGLAETTGKISLISQTGKLDVLYRFIDGTMEWCLMRVLEGKPQFTQSPSSDVKIKVKDFLQAMQSHTGDGSLASLDSFLDSVDVSKNSTKLSGNLRLDITITTLSSTVSFRWINVFNGADYTSFGVDFRDGVFGAFGDNRFYYSIGNTSINLSREEAISAALNCVKNYSYLYAGKEVANFSIAEGHISADLFTAPRDEPLVLYPYWDVRLPLASVYPGYIILIKVQFWADTGALNTIFPLGTGGGVDLSEPTPASSSTAISMSPQPSYSATSSPTLAPTTSPVPSASPTLVLSATPEPKQSTSSESTLQPSATPSLQPADNAGDQKSIDFSLLVAVAAVCVGVAVAVSLTLMYRRKRG